jgi:superfamily II DNA or RNA helicase
MLTLCLLTDKEGQAKKPIVIFAPATLCEQWQTEILDKLGLPTARWDTLNKFWVDNDERAISPSGRDQIARCPHRIGIISTGLMMRHSLEREHLLGLRFSVVILDEAHKARTRQGFGSDAGSPNELLAFIRDISARADHVLLGTATPIQTRPEDIWDLMGILHQGKGHFVLGNDFAPWHRPGELLGILAGRNRVTEPDRAWELLRSPLPAVESTEEPHARKLFSAIRQDLNVQPRDWQTSKPRSELTAETQETLDVELERTISGASFFQRENPLVRHVVLRKRASLEDAGLLARIGVDIHPDRARLKGEPYRFDGMFEGQALRTTDEFRAAYEQVRLFGKARGRSGNGGGFMTNLLEQRMCSSIHAGLQSARVLLAGRMLHEEEDDSEVTLSVQSVEESAALERLIYHLERIGQDPKLDAVLLYLTEEKWLELGIIIFSQYYDTAKWVADALAERFPEEPLGLYAGAGRSRLYSQGESVGIEREVLKKRVTEHQIRLMVATDAACEGLNLQTLGTLINIDLPWNPTRLEQRIGRIKRFGQRRESVDMLNLVFAQTVDEKIYQRLSERMRNRYDLFGSLPDTIRDEWIQDIDRLGEKLDEYINAQKTATGFDLRYTATMAPPPKDWRECSQVLSRRDLVSLLSDGWGS